MTKPNELKPWDRRPYPQHGDQDQDEIYTAVGRALSAWERYEAALAFLLANLVGPNEIPLPAQRAYAAVRTSEARQEMLKAASIAYFLTRTDCKTKDELQATFKDRLKEACAFCPRRNEIAHGVVDRFNEPGKTYALFPPYGSLKARDAFGKAEYCYTAADLEHYKSAFEGLRDPVIHLAALIQVFESECLRAARSAK